jgi:hypothetical protein
LQFFSLSKYVSSWIVVLEPGSQNTIVLMCFCMGKHMWVIFSKQKKIVFFSPWFEQSY